MHYTPHPTTRKRGYSLAEYAVFIVVLGVLCAAVIPIFMRINSYKRNAQRVADVKSISQMVTSYHTKQGEFPGTLRVLEQAGLGGVPKDPSSKIYCTGTPEYQSGDYQYFACKDCDAVGPLKTYGMKNIVQVGALMEWENKKGESNSGNRWAKYKVGENSNCAANAVWGAGTLIEGVKGNWIGGTGDDVRNIQTPDNQPDYAPWYNVIISMERN